MSKTKSTFGNSSFSAGGFSKNSFTPVDSGGDPLANPERELSDEIKSFREKKRAFDATNDHQSYLIVMFSTKDDKNAFLTNTGLLIDSTMVDGYELARHVNLKPDKPSLKLPKPF